MLKVETSEYLPSAGIESIALVIQESTQMKDLIAITTENYLVTSWWSNNKNKKKEKDKKLNS